jgi:hypothetical protein
MYWALNLLALFKCSQSLPHHMEIRLDAPHQFAMISGVNHVLAAVSVFGSYSRNTDGIIVIYSP